MVTCALCDSWGEKLIADIENNRLKPMDLIKAYTAATTQVAVKRRWSQGLGAGDERSRDALAGALEALQDGASVWIEKPDPTDSAIDITPCDEAGETTGAR